MSNQAPSSRRFAYRKLIRDKILDTMRAGGQSPDYRIMEQKEYLNELCKKLIEEAKELDPNDPAEILDGLADLGEVMDALLKSIDKSQDDLKAAKLKKFQKYGGFDGRIYLESVLTPSDNPWYRHLDSHPDRYPEIK